MRMRIFLLLLSAVSFHGCTRNESLRERFDSLKAIDYSEFSDMSIVNRKGIYLVTYHGTMYSVKTSFLTNKISSIELDSGKNKKVVWTKENMAHVEHALKSFDKIDVLALSVDEYGNVNLSLPWYDRCTYYFLKLLPNSTLEGIKKQHYKKYEANWYLNKECAER